MAEYELVGKGSLKLKGVADSGIKKKKKKSKDSKKVMEQAIKAQEAPVEGGSEEVNKIQVSKTPAQMAFEEMQEKRLMMKIVERASKTHKQRVEEFNRHLDSLTEHYDIPKVSWTK